jgi:CubicO group peptidase (beta-lactamase class C family)
MKRRTFTRTLFFVSLPLLILLTHIFFLRPIFALMLSRSPAYAYRAYFWGESDLFDYEKFPYREVQNASPTYYFSQDPNPNPLTESPEFETLLADSGTTAFLVVQDDFIKYEGYFNGFQREAWFTSFSVAKSYDSALIGIAIAEGAIGSVNDRVIQYLPELRGRGLDNLTIRNLLKMDCGVRYRDALIWDVLASYSDDTRTYYTPDLRGLALTIRPSEESLGACFHYNNFYPILEGMILERVTGMTVSEYLQEKIWKPLGMEFPATWSINETGSGLEKMESGINARPIDFVKFGRLYLNQGNWEGVQIIPQDWVLESTAPEPGENRPQVGAVALPKPDGYYQYHWWGTRRPGGYYDYTAVGHLGQYIFVRPDQNLIIARFGRETKTSVNWFEKFQEIAALFSR